MLRRLDQHLIRMALADVILVIPTEIAASRVRYRSRAVVVLSLRGARDSGPTTVAQRVESSRSIVVLPFEQVIAAEEHPFVADGLTEALITVLSQVHCA